MKKFATVMLTLMLSLLPLTAGCSAHNPTPTVSATVEDTEAAKSAAIQAATNYYNWILSKHDDTVPVEDLESVIGDKVGEDLKKAVLESPESFRQKLNDLPDDKVKAIAEKLSNPSLDSMFNEGDMNMPDVITLRITNIVLNTMFSDFLLSDNTKAEVSVDRSQVTVDGNKVTIPNDALTVVLTTPSKREELPLNWAGLVLNRTQSGWKIDGADYLKAKVMPEVEESSK